MESCLKSEGCFTYREKFYIMLFLTVFYMLWTLNETVEDKKEKFYNTRYY